MSARSLRAIPGFADPFSSLSHLIGAAVFLVLGIILVRRAIRTGHSTGGVWSLAIFSFTAVFLLSMSGVFHLLGTQGRSGQARMVMQRLDHAAIFCLIAGTFTPVHAMLFRGIRRWGVLWLIWTLAVAGVTLKTIYFRDLPFSLGLAVYLGMGWIGSVSMFLAARRWGVAFIVPLLMGGMFYTVGAVIEFMRPRTLIAGVVRSHEVFHVAVLLGLGAHWWFMWRIAGSLRNDPRSTPGGKIPSETAAASRGAGSDDLASAAVSMS
jgi:channel protein (hemolysin III family)